MLAFGVLREAKARPSACFGRSTSSLAWQGPKKMGAPNQGRSRTPAKGHTNGHWPTPPYGGVAQGRFVFGYKSQLPDPGWRFPRSGSCRSRDNQVVIATDDAGCVVGSLDLPV